MENRISKVVVGLTMLLDGFVNDNSGSVASLYYDFESFRETESLIETIEKTGVAVMGRNASSTAYVKGENGQQQRYTPNH